MATPTLSPRAIRAIALIAVSLVALAVVIAVHVRPAPAAAPLPAASRQPDPASTMDWISGREGWISALDRQAGTSTLFHTTDGGRHWTRQRASRAVETPDFFDARHGALVSDAGALLTADGGGRWQRAALPAGAGTPVFADAGHGWVWDPPAAALFSTVDGGAHWRRLAGTGLPAAPPAPRLLGFRDAAHGWLALGQALYGTADGGRSWGPVPLPAPPDRPYEIGPLSVTADGRGQVLVSGPATRWVAATADGGATWSALRPLPAGTSNLATSRADGAVSWAWSAGELLVTHDAGGHWTPVALPGWSLLRVRAVDARTIWVAATVVDALGADRWTLFSSGDAGVTWIPAITPALG